MEPGAKPRTVMEVNRVGGDKKNQRPGNFFEVPGYTPYNLDVEDGAELPNLMGWGGHDFQKSRADLMQEIAEQLSVPNQELTKKRKPNRTLKGNG